MILPFSITAKVVFVVGCLIPKRTPYASALLAVLATYHFGYVVCVFANLNDMLT
jgi:hypothetical protein